jgi:hypothetical protein
VRSTRYSKPDGLYYHPPAGWEGKGFFVSRNNGAVWSFGPEPLSPERLQYMLDFYDEGWRREPYRLKVNYVADTLQFAELIVEKGLAYKVLELEHDVVWSRAVKYDLETVLARVCSLMEAGNVFFEKHFVSCNSAPTIAHSPTQHPVRRAFSPPSSVSPAARAAQRRRRRRSSRMAKPLASCKRS